MSGTAGGGAEEVGGLAAEGLLVPLLSHLLNEAIYVAVDPNFPKVIVHGVFHSLLDD